MKSHDSEPAPPAAIPMNPLNVPETIPLATLPKGFRYSAAACGLRRKNRLDVGAIVADQPAKCCRSFHA